MTCKAVQNLLFNVEPWQVLFYFLHTLNIFIPTRHLHSLLRQILDVYVTVFGKVLRNAMPNLRTSHTLDIWLRSVIGKYATNMDTSQIRNVPILGPLYNIVCVDVHVEMGVYKK